MTGVARRHNMPLEDIQVEIKYPGLFGGKPQNEEAAAEGRTITKKAIKRITLKGDLSEKDLQILRNTAKHCPVGQFFRGGALEFTDEIMVVR